MEVNRRFPSPSYTQLIPAENWFAGDESIHEVMNCVYPTLDSEEKRKDVIEYLQNLIRYSVGVEIFPYGSVPLKTYLPDGDIDLTVLCDPTNEYLLPEDVLSVLRYHEEMNEITEFELKDIQFIDAEVKLVKFVAQDMVIDLSFNQLGGLYSLGFLERIDRIIGRDHLFKRSIMLIKTWCYYESRILGAHYSLISTYGLELLVLYIILHVFDATLTSPLMILYRFLEYFGNFDWDNYCISLDGPVIKAYLPHIVVDNSIDHGTGGLLSGEFLRNCVDMFMVPLKFSETNVRAFRMKYFNIMDPLKENNNVGRSVNRGNYYRIRSALKYGASKLREVLESPSGNIREGIQKFFINTIQNHKSRNIHDATFRTLSSSSFSEDENADLDDYISGTTDDVLGFESTETVDLSAFRSLNLTPANELADGDMNLVDSYFLDLKKGETSGGIGDTENLNMLADLTGDYDSHVRSLLYGQCCHGYGLSSALFGTSDQALFYGGLEPWEVAANTWSAPFQPNSFGPQMNPNNGVSQHAPYVAGHNMARAGEPPVQWDERNTVRGTGTYFPVMNSPRGRGRRGHFSGSRQPQRNRRGPVETNRGPAQTNRGPVHMNHGPVQTNSGRVQTNRGPVEMNGGPVEMSRGPVEVSRGPVEVSRGPVEVSRGPVEMSRGPVEMNPGPVEVNRGPVEMNPCSGASHEGPDPSERSSPPSRGSVGSPRPVNRRRKLEFGSFGSVPEPTSDAEASSSNVVCGRNPGRINVESIHLKNEDEFPPLSA